MIDLLRFDSFIAYERMNCRYVDNLKTVEYNRRQLKQLFLTVFHSFQWYSGFIIKIKRALI